MQNAEAVPEIERLVREREPARRGLERVTILAILYGTSRHPHRSQARVDTAERRDALGDEPRPPPGAAPRVERPGPLGDLVPGKAGEVLQKRLAQVRL